MTSALWGQAGLFLWTLALTEECAGLLLAGLLLIACLFVIDVIFIKWEIMKQSHELLGKTHFSSQRQQRLLGSYPVPVPGWVLCESWPRRILTPHKLPVRYRSLLSARFTDVGTEAQGGRALAPKAVQAVCSVGVRSQNPHLRPFATWPAFPPEAHFSFTASLVGAGQGPALHGWPWWCLPGLGGNTR